MTSNRFDELLGARRGSDAPNEPVAHVLPTTASVGKLFTLAAAGDLHSALRIERESLRRELRGLDRLRLKYSLAPVVVAITERALPFVNAWLNPALVQVETRYGDSIPLADRETRVVDVLHAVVEELVRGEFAYGVWDQPGLVSIAHQAARSAIARLIRQAIDEEGDGHHRSPLHLLNADMRSRLEANVASLVSADYGAHSTRSTAETVAVWIEWDRVLSIALGLLPGPEELDLRGDIPLQLSASVNWELFSELLVAKVLEAARLEAAPPF